MPVASSRKPSACASLVHRAVSCCFPPGRCSFLGMNGNRAVAIILLIGVALFGLSDSLWAQGNNPFTGSGAFDGAAPRGALGSLLGRVQIQLQDAMGRLFR